MNRSNFLRTRILTQTGETCWFLAILNGFLATDIGRKYLSRALRDFKRQTLTSDEERRNFDTARVPSACLRSYRPTKLFFKVVQMCLLNKVSGGTTLHQNVIRNVIPSVSSMQNIPAQIISDKMMELINTIKASSHTQVYDYNKNLISFASDEPYIKIIKYYADYPTGGASMNVVQSRTNVDSRFQNTPLSFLLVQLINLGATASHPHASHFIAAVRIQGDMYFIDSNGFVGKITGNVIADAKYREFCMQTYGFTFEWSFPVMAVYIKNELPPVRATPGITGKRKRNVNTLRTNRNGRAKKRTRT